MNLGGSAEMPASILNWKCQPKLPLTHWIPFRVDEISGLV